MQLPEEFARDTERVARFQREAKLLASLNHPNIAAIHGLEESEGTHFLVLELVEGDTLSERIKAGPIPVEESLKLALQIAEALEAAHEKGVIHRDLKPSNIKVTPEGKIKVLDFGLAKAYAGDQEDMILSDSPTISAAATQKGVILGTAAYMSPEQTRGKSVDKRADIWAFGCVLYEMLTGQVAFRGEDVSEILASVIKGDVRLDLLPTNLHPRVREVITRCLQRDLRRRYSGITDARYEIEQALADPSGVLVQPIAAAGTQTRLRQMLPWIAAIILVGLIVGLVVWQLRAPEPSQVIRFDYELPEGLGFEGNLPIDVSPDGRVVVYSTSEGLFLRSVDELTAKLIAGTEGDARQPFFSADGKWIGFFSYTDRQLKKISINGGAPVTLCDIAGSTMAGASWSTDNSIVYSAYPSEIMRVSAGGGTPESIVKRSESGSAYLAIPHILPDGKSLLYNIAGTGQPRMMVQPLKSGEPKELLAGWFAGYVPSGYIVYSPPNDNTLFAVPFDLDRLEIVGEPVPLVEGAAAAAISDSGTLAYVPETSSADYQGNTLVWVDRNGKEESLGTPLNTYAYPKISPDGTRVAFSIGSFPDLDIWIWDIVRKSLSKLTFEKTREMDPIWAPNGKRIAYWADTAGASPNGLYLKAADGTGEAEKLISAEGDRALHPSSWSSDGKTLLLQEFITWSNFDLCALPVESDHTLKPLFRTEHVEHQPEISPDGRWITYTSNESEREEVYVRPFPEVNKGKWQVSTSGGNSPLWSPDMRELFYLSEDNVAMAVSVETKPTLRFGTPKMLFKNTNLSFNVFTGTPWDIHPDGKRFLMMKLPDTSPSSEEAPKPKIIIVTNWFEELKERVPIP